MGPMGSSDLKLGKSRRTALSVEFSVSNFNATFELSLVPAPKIFIKRSFHLDAGLRRSNSLRDKRIMYILS